MKINYYYVINTLYILSEVKSFRDKPIRQNGVLI